MVSHFVYRYVLHLSEGISKILCGYSHAKFDTILIILYSKLVQKIVRKNLRNFKFVWKLQLHVEFCLQICEILLLNLFFLLQEVFIKDDANKWVVLIGWNHKKITQGTWECLLSLFNTQFSSYEFCRPNFQNRVVHERIFLYVAFRWGEKSRRCPFK